MALAVWAFIAAAPQGALAQNSEYITGVSYTDISQIMQAFGDEHELITAPNGQRVMLGRKPSGFIYLVGLQACGTELDPNCVGIDIRAGFDPGNEPVDTAALAAFERRVPFIKVFTEQIPDTNRYGIVISRYVTTDFGVTRKNVLSNFFNFFAITKANEDNLPNASASLDKDGAAGAVVTPASAGLAEGHLMNQGLPEGMLAAAE